MTRAAPVVLALLLVAPGCRDEREDPLADAIVMERGVLEYLREPDSIRVRVGGRRAETLVTAVSPVSPGKGQSRPALALVAGARAQVELPDLGEPGVLRLAASPTLATYGHAPAEGASLTLTVLLDDEPAESTAWRVAPDFAEQVRAWRPLEVRFDGAREAILEVRAKGDWPGGVLAVSELEIVQRERVPRATRTAGAPDLCLVVIDTLRADRLEPYGYASPTSPRIAELARRGTLFEQAIAPAPWTWPSTASILTGLEPSEHGVLDTHSCFLPGSLETLPERLARAGFTTAGWSTNPLVHESRNWDQGFEHWRSWSWERAAPALEDVRAFLDARPTERTFLYLHLTEPHMPYVPEPWAREALGVGPPPDGFDADEFRNASQDFARLGPDKRAAVREQTPYASELYDAEVLCADRAVGELLDELDARGRLEETLFVVTSDHGEEFWEHGLTGHAHQLFRESVHVPLVLAGPGIEADARVSEPVALHRLGPTLVEALGLRNAPGTAPSLFERLPTAWLGSATETGWWSGETVSRRLLSARSERELLLWAWPTADEAAAGEITERVAYYDLERDGGELHPLEEHPRAVELRAELERWWADGQTRSPGALGGGEEVEDLLRAAGYLEAR